MSQCRCINLCSCVSVYTRVVCVCVNDLGPFSSVPRKRYPGSCRKQGKITPMTAARTLPHVHECGSVSMYVYVFIPTTRPYATLRLSSRHPLHLTTYAWPIAHQSPLLPPNSLPVKPHTSHLLTLDGQGGLLRQERQCLLHERLHFGSDARLCL